MVIRMTALLFYYMETQKYKVCGPNKVSCLQWQLFPEPVFYAALPQTFISYQLGNCFFYLPWGLDSSKYIRQLILDEGQHT